MMAEPPYAEPFKIKMVEHLRKSSKEQREVWIKQTKYNVFKLKSEYVFIDLLSDSGTGCMSDKQWSRMMIGDESYAGSSSYYTFENTIKDIFGLPYVLPTHQGRAAENVLFTVLVKKDYVIPGNSQFDTTKAHIEYRLATSIDCTIDEAFDTNSYYPFKGNICPKKLMDVLNTYPKKNIPFIVFTVTNNNVGGQPVSMQNIKQISIIAKKHKIPLLFDSARYAENAYFIKQREEGYSKKTISDIVKEMYKHADMVTMSAKKGGLVNIGGFLALRNEDVYKQSCTYNILFEGYLTYGGMSGRDMEAVAQGLIEGMDEKYLESRIKQVEYLGRILKENGIPIQYPVGGHAVFINAVEMLPNVSKYEFPAQTLSVELYKETGVRAAEIGAILADRDPVTRNNRFPKVEFLRLAIPRRTYTDNHMRYVAAGLKHIYDRRMEVKRGYVITWEAPIARHFTVELERCDNENLHENVKSKL